MPVAIVAKSIINDDWCWFILTNAYWFWLMLISADWYADWCWLVVIDADWCWSILTNAVWFWLMQINADLCWLMLIDADRYWLILSNVDWCWLMLIDACWCWFICWLMLKQGSTGFSFFGAYLRSISGHFYSNQQPCFPKHTWCFAIMYSKRMNTRQKFLGKQ